MALITTTELNDSIPTIVAAAALGALKANTVLARLVNRDWENELAQYGQTVNITKRGALTAADKVEGTAFTAQAPTDSKYTLTLNKHKVVPFAMEDLARMLSRPDQFNGYITDAMIVLAEQMDYDIATLYSGLGQTIDATAGLDESDFREARRLINAAKAPLAQRVAVLHEDAEFEMLGMEKAINAEYAQALGQAAASAWTGRFMGFDVFMDQMVRVVGAQCKNLLFQRDAFVMATRPMAIASPGLGVQQVTMAEDGIGLRVTRSYSHGDLAEICSVDVLYGVAELYDDHGVAVSTTEK